VAWVAVAGSTLVSAGLAATELGGFSTIDETVPPSAASETRFPHSLHAEELEFECSECHHEIDAARLRMPHDSYFEDFWIDCRSCHRETDAPAEPQSCTNCHHASPVSTADETLSAKVVIHRACWGCHDSGTGQEASRGCSFCHPGWRSPEEEGR
jgi:hypothetical protein